MTTMTAAQVRLHTGGMEPDPEVPERPRPPRTYSAASKLRILGEYEQLDKAGKGALLRREGLYTSLISEWRKQRDKGALQAFQPRRGARRSTRWCARTPGWSGRTRRCATSLPGRPR